MKNPVLTLMVVGGVLISPYSAMAIGRRTVTCEAAQRGMTLTVSNGIGVDIKLACAGNIADAQVSDPSRIVVRKRGPQQLYIKPIGTVDFPGNLHSSDGTTMLSVVTTTGEIYQFGIRPTSGSSYSFLDVGGHSEHLPVTTAYRPRPLPPRFASAPQPTPFHAPPVPTVTAEHPYKLVKPLPLAQPVPQPLAQVPQPLAQPSPSPQLFDASVASEKQSPSAAASPVPQQPPSPSSTKEPDFSASVDSPVPQQPPSASPAKEPDFSAAADSPVPQKPSPTLSTQKVALSSSSSTPASQANAIVRGLAQLRREKKIAYRSGLWFRVQDVVYLLRKGKDIEGASKQAGVPISKIQYLIALGGNKSNSPV